MILARLQPYMEPVGALSILEKKWLQSRHLITLIPPNLMFNSVFRDLHTKQFITTSCYCLKLLPASFLPYKKSKICTNFYKAVFGENLGRNLP